ncbi:Tetratricopeptide TPR_1 repeat-containing protein [Planktothrix serta PCC 8927]|uniref:Tetratricopeptide TPR_1 repeat-containing protein n=1 Tax=Planktothrix serta PCC 8927 TaxID=671068 RepID=A0A7Z9BPG3_9CYAN|nr:CHAT domain-containing protein [Planktothrix serta]VXD17543.1 Tetratricopeptide TPR_1 repeat-containing protein [Planktothrix serta PCC 8927]
MKIRVQKIILAFLTGFFIAWGLMLFPAFPQSTSKLSDPQVLVEHSRERYQAGDFSEAVTILKQAIHDFKIQGNKQGQAIALSNLSLVFEKLGQLQTAYSYITESLNLLTHPEFPHSPKILAQSLEIRGQLELEMGSSEQALRSWKQAANIYEGINDSIAKIRIQINMAQAQQTLGMYRQAKATLEQVEDNLQTQPDSLMKAIALRSLGNVLQLVGDLETALIVLQKSQEIAENLQSPTEVSATLLSLGNTQKALGNRAQIPEYTTTIETITPLSCPPYSLNKDTLNHYNQAIQFYEKSALISPNIVTQTQAKINQLNSLLKLQQWADVKNLYLEIQLNLTKISPAQDSIYAQINLAHNLACFKQFTATDIPSWLEIAQTLTEAIQQAKNIGNQRLETYATGSLAGIYLKNNDIEQAQKLTQNALLLAQQIKAEDIAYLWYWQLGYLLKIQGDIKGAIICYNEAINILKSLRSDLVTLNPDIQFSFRDNVEPVYRQFVDLLLQTENNIPVSQNNLKQARDVIEALQLSELENFFREACLEARPQQIDEIVDKIDPTAAVIYPIILPNRLEIILKLPTDNEFYHFTTYKPETEVESHLEQLQQYLREPDRTNDVKKLSQEVYRWLIKPLETELEKKQIKTLVFILEGSLRNLPMSVLYDEKKQQYLIQKYAIAVAPGLQLVKPQPLPRRELYALIGGVSEERQIADKKFTALGNVKLELQEIKSEIHRSQQLLNQSFTEIDLKNKIESNPFSVVHLATHGQFSSNQDQTFILTWETLLKAKEFDQLLRLRDTNNSTAIELLVLSACQTAAGDKRATLGLAGIAVRAGARSTLATLWSVDDQSTTKLMSLFYQQFANINVTKAEALRRAQLMLLDEDEIPYFWSPYVLVGNWL